MEFSKGYSLQVGQHSPSGVTRDSPDAVKMKVYELKDFQRKNF
jgi:hypothetical protein